MKKKTDKKAQSFDRLSSKAQSFSRLSSKAQSHLEIILSFVLFVGFIIFIFIIINPLAKTEDKTDALENIQKIVIREISSDIGKLSIILEKDNGICYSFDETNYNNGDINIKYFETNPANRKYELYFSDIFTSYYSSIKYPENPVQGCALCTSCDSKNYTLGVYSKEKIIFYNDIKALKQSYDSDYVLLKKELGINNGFLFNFRYIDSEIISNLSVSKQIPSGVDVESKEILINVINSSADFEEMILNIKVW